MSGALAGFLAGSAGAVFVGVLTNLLAKESEGFIEALPALMLRLARRRLPAGRDDLYDEWAAELHVALHETEGRPLTRLVLGIGYAAGLLRSARRIADELGPARNTEWAEESATPADSSGMTAGRLTPELTGRAAFQPSGKGPTVLRMVLGSELRRLRTTRQITREEAASAIRASDDQVGRMEQGRLRFRERDLADLLTFYDVRDATERESLLSLALQSDKHNWWHSYSDSLPAGFDVYLRLEEAAWRVRAYEEQVVPALLRTEDYARSLAERGHPEARDHDIGLLMRRQERLEGDGSFSLWAVMDETALRRPLVDRQVLRRQIGHLIEVSELRKVVLQVLPFGCGRGAVARPFSILCFPEPEIPDVAYIEQLTGGLYVDNPTDRDRYREAMEQLCIDAAPPNFTRAILTDILKEL